MSKKAKSGHTKYEQNRPLTPQFERPEMLARIAALENPPAPPTDRELLAQCLDLLHKFYCPCPNCGQTTILLGWCEGKSIVVCDNYGCRKYRQPMGIVVKVAAMIELRGIIAARLQAEVLIIG